ncbi:hypothetical protein JOC86_002335 [Bacillus pakistanensis]|uniref:Uncharacterized protein n=1 Tax=Rossellomorea pakistanensis TaxID=992288 RepID=A0ABS2ND66_9BACI|nr:hypothetical protein [Bacillus pakistanensis]
MLMGILGSTYTILFVILAAFGVKQVTRLIPNDKNHEWHFFFKALFLGGISSIVLYVNSRYFLLESFAKAGITITLLLLILIPVLIVLKNRKPESYISLINQINKFI